MTAVSDLLARRKPVQQKVRLLLDGSLAVQIDDLRREIRQTKAADVRRGSPLDTAVPELERRLEELVSQADAEAAEFTFQAVGRAKLEELKRLYPPTDEQWERFREQVKGNLFAQAPEFDWAGLAPALIASCCVEPEMTEADAARLWDELSDGEAAQLFQAAWAVNETSSPRPFFGTATDTTPSSGPDSTTPRNGGSPSLSLAEGS